MKKRGNKWYFYKSPLLLCLAPSNDLKNMCSLHKLINMIEKTHIASRGSRGQHHTPPAFNDWIWWLWDRQDKDNEAPSSSAMQSLRFFLKIQKASLPENCMPRGHTVPNSSTIMEVIELQKCGTKQAALLQREVNWTWSQRTLHLKPRSNIRTFCLPSVVIREPSFKYHSANGKTKWGWIHFWWVLGHDLYPNLFPTTPPMCSWKQKASL